MPISNNRLINTFENNSTRPIPSENDTIKSLTNKVLDSKYDHLKPEVHSTSNDSFQEYEAKKTKLQKFEEFKITGLDAALDIAKWTDFEDISIRNDQLSSNHRAKLSPSIPTTTANWINKSLTPTIQTVLKESLKRAQAEVLPFLKGNLDDLINEQKTKLFDAQQALKNHREVPTAYFDALKKEIKKTEEILKTPPTGKILSDDNIKNCITLENQLKQLKRQIKENIEPNLIKQVENELKELNRLTDKNIQIKKRSWDLSLKTFDSMITKLEKAPTKEPLWKRCKKTASKIFKPKMAFETHQEIDQPRLQDKILELYDIYTKHACEDFEKNSKILKIISKDETGSSYLQKFENYSTKLHTMTNGLKNLHQKRNGNEISHESEQFRVIPITEETLLSENPALHLILGLTKELEKTINSSFIYKKIVEIEDIYNELQSSSIPSEKRLELEIRIFSKNQELVSVATENEIDAIKKTLQLKQQIPTQEEIGSKAEKMLTLPNNTSRDHIEYIKGTIEDQGKVPLDLKELSELKEGHTYTQDYIRHWIPTFFKAGDNTSSLQRYRHESDEIWERRFYSFSKEMLNEIEKDNESLWNLILHGSCQTFRNSLFSGLNSLMDEKASSLFAIKFNQEKSKMTFQKTSDSKLLWHADFYIELRGYEFTNKLTELPIRATIEINKNPVTNEWEITENLKIEKLNETQTNELEIDVKEYKEALDEEFFDASDELLQEFSWASNAPLINGAVFKPSSSEHQPVRVSS